VTRSARPCLLVAALLAACNGTAAAGESAPAASVVDGAGLFRNETIFQADTLIQDLRRDYHFDVRVETLKALPDSEAKHLASLSTQRAKYRYVDGLARDRAAAANVDGLYVLICTAAPPSRFVAVAAYPDAARDVFSDFKRRQLHKSLVEGLKGATAGAGDDSTRVAIGVAVGFGWVARPLTGPDDAILQALYEVAHSVRERKGDPNAIHSWPVGVLLLSGISLWLVLRIVGRRMAARAPDTGLLRPTRPDRTPGLLAARFGNPAAYWIYDRLFYGSPPEAPKPPEEGIVATLPAEHEAPTSDLIHPEPEANHADAVTPDGPA
jgi:hypothetical protein